MQQFNNEEKIQMKTNFCKPTCALICKLPNLPLDTPIFHALFSTLLRSSPLRDFPIVAFLAKPK